ncbi:MAG: hypothetical protein KGJ80_14250, partial [Chloroflexota bacterium]|nr:hypothetical protein [Chloroflexota bacterium]
MRAIGIASAQFERRTIMPLGIRVRVRRKRAVACLRVIIPRAIIIARVRMMIRQQFEVVRAQRFDCRCRAAMQTLAAQRADAFADDVRNQRVRKREGDLPIMSHFAHELRAFGGLQRSDHGVFVHL